MNYARSDELRRELSLLRNNLAYPQNQAVLEKLLALRYELAQLLGFENYAAWVTADKMSGSPERVQSFLDELAGYTTATQEAEYAILLARLRQDQPDAQRVESWQYSYLLEKVKAEQFNVDAKQVREYFSYQGTRDGIFALVQDLFNVQIKPWEAYTWAEDVETYSLWDGDTLIGNFYLDMHPRPNKYQHAAQFPLRTGITGVQTPVAALVCNFPAGDELMEHGDVETFLHEFGHLLHNMFAGGHHWADVSGINTEWDFVEAPSQMLEEWVWDYDTVSRFAHNAAGEPVPEALLKRMRAARDFGLGIDTRRQLAFAATSLNVYNRNPVGFDLKTLTDEIAREYTPFEPLKKGHFYASFGHLNNYSAIYYTYQWSLAIASDLFTRFRDEGLRNVETAGEYRDKVLGQGGAKPAAELVRDFLGRDVSFKPYADRLSQAGQPAANTE
jgi:thimet oligopeptidase